MLCYKCGSHVPDTQTACVVCGHRMSSSAIRQISRSYSRKTLELSADGGLFKLEEKVAGRYVVQALLGEGAAGFSYNVYDETLKANVCLKVIHPQLLQTAGEQRHFEVVLKQVARLLHSNVSRVFDVGNAKERMFYTQQYTEGLSLRRIIDERLLKGSLFSCKELEPILVQLIYALEAVHRMGAHLNLKPGNIFVLPDLLRLTDVGLGLAIPRGPFVQAHRTRREESYFAPEFLLGMEAGISADVYSLGVIMGEMLAGILPDGNVPSLSKNNPDVPEELEAIYGKTIAASPLARYRSTAEFHEDFIAFYKRYTQKSEKEASSGMLIPLHAEGFPEVGVASDTSTPSVPSGDLSHVELKDLLPKRTVRTLQWVAIALGALVVVGILIALMTSEPEELTGRNVEGFRQTAPVVPPGALGNEESAKAPPPPPSLHTEEAASPEPSSPPPSFHTEEVKETPPPPPVEVRPEPPRTPPTPPKVAAPPVEVSRCPERMLRIPAGSFRMGTERDDVYLSFEDLPASSREVGGFCIDIYEYPNRSGQLPTVNVGWAGAQELCQKQSKRLCTEVEWEKACRGSNGLRWPYGNTFSDGICNSASEAGAARALAAAGKFSRCISPHAVFDMSGNVAEWTEERVAKGGSFSSSDVGARCAARNPRASANAETGFRCCANLK